MRKLISYSKDEDYFKDIIEDIKKNKIKTCYISFNKSNDFLREEFQRNGIRNENIFIIDAITKTISKKKVKAQKNTKFISEPYRLDDISDEVKRIIKRGYNLVVLDSLSNLLTHYPESNKEILLDFVKSFADEKNPNLLFALNREDGECAPIETIYSFFNTYQKEIVPLGFR